MYIFILYTLILSWILFSISLEDIKTMILSERKLLKFTLFGISYLICLALSNNEINIKDIIINNFIGMLCIYLIMYAISCISYKVFRINSLGLGDIKLSSISSIWLGFELSFISLCLSFILSSIYSLYGKITKKFKPFHQYPFAPFLSIGIFCTWILDKI